MHNHPRKCLVKHDEPLSAKAISNSVKKNSKPSTSEGEAHQREGPKTREECLRNSRSVSALA